MRYQNSPLLQWYKAYLVPFALVVSTLFIVAASTAEETDSFVKCLSSRPAIVLEEIKDLKPKFDPPFQYTGPYMENSYSRSLGSLFLFGLFGINVISADPAMGIWICNSPCGPVVIGNAIISSEDKEVRTKEPLKLSENEIANLLKSQNPVKRATAIWALTQSRDKKNLPTIIEKLEDTDPLVRLYTLHAIGILAAANSDAYEMVRSAPAPKFQPEAAKGFFEKEIETVLSDTLQRLSSPEP